MGERQAAGAGVGEVAVCAQLKQIARGQAVPARTLRLEHQLAGISIILCLDRDGIILCKARKPPCAPVCPQQHFKGSAEQRHRHGLSRTLPAHLSTLLTFTRFRPKDTLRSQR